AFLLQNEDGQPQTLRPIGRPTRGRQETGDVGSMPGSCGNGMSGLRSRHASPTQQKGRQQADEIGLDSRSEVGAFEEGLDSGRLREEDHAEIPFSTGELRVVWSLTHSSNRLAKVISLSTFPRPPKSPRRAARRATSKLARRANSLVSELRRHLVA